MNCKSGDLAYVTLGELFGRVVTVTTLDPFVDEAPCWFYEGVPIPCVGDPTRHYLSLRDAVLCPIRNPGDDARDESLAWTQSPKRVHGCIPVTDPVDEELARAISNLFHLSVNDAERALRAASNHALRLVVGTAPTELGRPL